ncbi:MAG: 2-oxo acid dehydrogenase subunit E2 [Gammaproteobacteria bacterium]|nr:2-oxo acid dehydrogenase subunit E2 [Gammaproteobacteria bacterium]
MIELLLPDLGEDIVSGTIITALVEAGTTVNRGETLFEVETDKVTIEIPSEVDGVIHQLFARPGDEVAIGDRIASIEPTTGSDNRTETKSAFATVTSRQETDTPHQQSTSAATQSPDTTAAVPAGPAARRMARVLGIDIHSIPGSRQRGRICKQDVIIFARQQLQNSNKIEETTTHQLPDLQRFGTVNCIPLDNIQRATARNMARAWREIPHAWMQEEIDVTELEQQRQRLKSKLVSKTQALTITPFIIKAMAISIAKYPLFNASMDIANNQIVYRHYIDIGVAIDTPRGLMVPTIRGVESLKPQTIAEKIAALSARAQQNSLLPDELQGAGITLSNLGNMGLCSIYPIINWPQSAIVGTAATHWSQKRNSEGLWKEHLLLPLTLAFDHRLINGADGAKFIAHLKSLLENPQLLAH